VDEFWPNLSARDLVLEPSCGRGAFLKAIPRAVEAVGVEIDPELAAEAAAHTGRRVLCGDFRTIELDLRPTVILGNPPYRMSTLDAFLGRAGELLPDNGQCGFLLASYMLQTPSTVLWWNERSSLEQRLVPRTLFSRAIRPLVFVLFTKDRQRKLLGGLVCESSQRISDDVTPSGHSSGWAWRNCSSCSPRLLFRNADSISWTARSRQPTRDLAVGCALGWSA
jgi:hypothetical protein